MPAQRSRAEERGKIMNEFTIYENFRNLDLDLVALSLFTFGALYAIFISLRELRVLPLRQSANDNEKMKYVYNILTAIILMLMALGIKNFTQ